MRLYIFHILVALSQLGNALLGGFPDESMSARAHRTGSKGRWPGVVTRPLIDVFFYIVTFGLGLEATAQLSRINLLTERLQ